MITFNEKQTSSLYSHFSVGDTTNNGKSPLAGWTPIQSSGAKVQDLFDDSSVVDSYVVYDVSRSTSGKFSGLTFDISTICDALGLEVIWEYASKDGSSFYADWNWYPLEDVVDNTNGFTISGENEVTWKVPEDWRNCFGYSYKVTSRRYYNWLIRCRIVAMTSITEGGQATTVKYHDYSVNVEGGAEGSELTLDDIYNEDVANGWGVVTKSNNIYNFNCGLKFNPDCYFIAKQAVINFGINFDMWTSTSGNGVYITFGEIVIGDKTRYGCSIIFNGLDCDYGGSIIRKNGKLYNTQVKVIMTNTYGATNLHGHWGGRIGADLAQSVYGVIIEGFRQTNFSGVSNVVIGVTGVGNSVSGQCSCETSGAIIKDVTVYGGDYAFRTLRSTSRNNDFVHECDLSATVYPIQIYQSTYLSFFHFNAVDCNWGVIEDENKAYWVQTSGLSLPDGDHKVNEIYSFLLKTLDKKGSPIENASVTLKDNNGNEVLTGKTNEDGFATEDGGNITGVDVSYIQDSSKNWTTNDMKFKEFVVTSGDGVNQRRIIKYGNTGTQLPLAWDFGTVPTIGDRYIVVPYVVAKYMYPESYTSYCFSLITDLNPFTLEIKKEGYKDYTSTFDLTKKFDGIITLKKLYVEDFNIIRS